MKLRQTVPGKITFLSTSFTRNASSFSCVAQLENGLWNNIQPNRCLGTTHYSNICSVFSQSTGAQYIPGNHGNFLRQLCSLRLYCSVPYTGIEYNVIQHCTILINLLYRRQVSKTYPTKPYFSFIAAHNVQTACSPAKPISFSIIK